MKNKIIYSIKVEDIQTVANKELDRDLTKEEVKSIEDVLAEKIGWYEAIAESINEKIK